MNTKEFLETVLAKLENIEQRLDRIEKIKLAQDEHGCGKDEVWSEELQRCIPMRPCENGEHWSEEEGKCVPDNPYKTESAIPKGEGLTSETHYSTHEKLEETWQKEDEERKRMSENTTVT